VNRGGWRRFLAALTGALVVASIPARSAADIAGATASVAPRSEGQLIGRTLPDIPLTLADGRSVRLSELWGDKPLLLTFYYRRCPGICTPFLEWVRDAVHAVGGLGADYRVLALTFDDAETVADLRAQAAAFGLLTAPDWSFAVADRDAVARVAAALDYRYRLDPQTRQYDHDSLLVGIDRGRVVRAMPGTPGGSRHFRELIRELRGGFVPLYRSSGRTLFSCLRFDPQSGKARFDWGMLLLALPAAVTFTLALATFAGYTRRG
jgi:cytochrome oxidase Cu insertion factor (SCO1/SenC/PrrC family)